MGNGETWHHLFWDPLHVFFFVLLFSVVVVIVSFQQAFISLYSQYFWCFAFTIRQIGLPKWPSGKEPTCQCRRQKRLRFNPWLRKIHWKGKWQLSTVFLPGNPHGQRSLGAYSPWDCKSQTWLSEKANQPIMQICVAHSSFHVLIILWKVSFWEWLAFRKVKFSYILDILLPKFLSFWNFFVIVQSLIRVQPLVTEWIGACHVPQSFPISQSLLRFMSIEPLSKG